MHKQVFVCGDESIREGGGVKDLFNFNEINQWEIKAWPEPLVLPSIVQPHYPKKLYKDKKEHQRRTTQFNLCVSAAHLQGNVVPAG